MLVILMLGVTFGSLAADAQMLGPANVAIANIALCPESGLYPYTVYATRRKLNRTMDALDINVTLDFDLDENIGIYINTAKRGDGGYKPNFLELVDSNACAFFMKWLAEGFKKALRAVEHEESCPVRAGTWVVKDYILNFEELPKHMIYGDFRTDAYFTRGDERLACLRIFTLSEPKQLKLG